MKKKILIFLVFSIILVFAISGMISAATVTSWNFEIFNNPNARQVAFNIAKAQDELAQEEKDPITEFISGMDRRLESSVQREIMDMIMDDDRIAAGEYEVGNLTVKVAEDPGTGNVILQITNIETGETTIVEYSTNEWPTDYNSFY